MMAEADVEKSDINVDSPPENETVLMEEIEELSSGMNLQIEELIDPYDFTRPMLPDLDGNFSCSACEKKYRSKNHLKRHVSIVHLKIKKYPCPTCGKRFHSSQPLRIHQRIHTGYKPCKCDQCGKAFSDPSALRGHLRMHNRQMGIMCDICGKYMATENSLRNHKKRHEIDGHDKSSFQYQCPDCSLIFCAQADLESHFAEHRSARVYSCPDCPRSYKNFQSYQYHRRTHTGEKPFQCKECGTHFRSPNLVRLHSVVHKHPDERPKYRCDECGKDFSLIKTLNFHRCKGTYPCWVCKTMFSSMTDLEEHKSTHTVEETKRYLCKICGRRYSKSSVLKNHKCKMLVVVEYEEHEKSAPRSEPQEYEQYEFHIDLCKFVCKEDSSDEENLDETPASPNPDSTEVTGVSVAYEGSESQDETLAIVDDQEMKHESHDVTEDRSPLPDDVTEDRSPLADDVTEDRSASAGDAVQNNDEITLQAVTGDNPPHESSEANGDIKNHDVVLEDEPEPKWEIPEVDQPAMNPTCLLDKTCQKCGGDIDNDILKSGQTDPTCATHICPPTKKKKYMPLRQTLALKSSSPRRKVKGGIKKS